MFETILDFCEDRMYDIVSKFSYYSSEIFWCESKYSQSEYIVEYWNTITSLFISIVGLYGLMRSCKESKLFYFLLIFIGIASAYFHCTLSFAGQLLDELGISIIMIVANIILYANDKIGLQIIKIFGFLQLLVQFTYSTYNRYILFVYALLFLNKYWLMLRSKNRKIRWYSHISLTLFLISVTCWISDFYMCTKISPFNFHGMWHVMIGLTAYFTIESSFLFLEENMKDKNEELIYKYWSDFYEM